MNEIMAVSIFVAGNLWIILLLYLFWRKFVNTPQPQVVEINDWISVNDKLPEEGSWVLGKIPNPFGGEIPTVDFVRRVGLVWIPDARYGKNPVYVTHWFPVPGRELQDGQRPSL